MKYLRAVEESDFQLGEKRSLVIRYLLKSFDMLNRIVIETDAKAREKFSIEGVDFSEATIEEPQDENSAQPSAPPDVE